MPDGAARIVGQARDVGLGGLDPGCNGRRTYNACWKLLLQVHGGGRRIAKCRIDQTSRLGRLSAKRVVCAPVVDQCLIEARRDLIALTPIDRNGGLQPAHIALPKRVLRASKGRGSGLGQLLRCGQVGKHQLDFGTQQQHAGGELLWLAVVLSRDRQQCLRFVGQRQRTRTVTLAQMPGQRDQCAKSWRPLKRCQPALKQIDFLIEGEHIHGCSLFLLGVGCSFFCYKVYQSETGDDGRKCWRM